MKNEELFVDYVGDKSTYRPVNKTPTGIYICSFSQPFHECLVGSNFTVLLIYHYIFTLGLILLCPITEQRMSDISVDPS